MIHRVEINNFALVEFAELDLGPGLTVLSGETGAGKSIVIDALDFASGSRSDRSMLRIGAQEASVSLLIDDGKYQGDEDSLVFRALKESGRSYAKLDGQLVTAGELRDKMEPLLAIHSQNDQQSIFKEAVHRELFDAFGGKKIEDLKKRWSLARIQMTDIQDKLLELFSDPETRARRRDILVYQIHEIEEARPQPGEDGSLLKKIKTLTAVREIAGHLDKALSGLMNEEGSAATLMNRVIGELSAAGRYSSKMTELQERAEGIKAELSDLGYDMQKTAERLDDRPGELEAANERLLLLRKLEEKYGPGLDQVLLYEEKARAELLRLDNTEGELLRLKNEKEELTVKLKELQDEFRNVREEKKKELEAAINRELSDLDMKNASFTVEITDKDLEGKAIPQDPQDIRFLIAPNPGEPSMPLVSIISGGEASRVLLAIKAVLAGLDDISTIIFDEIDTGISGSTTTKIAEKLKAIARKAQVLCVTHNAQIAAFADSQLLIGKEQEGGRTRTTVKKITGEARIDEIARLLSGRPGDEKSRLLARDLLARASNE
ncbi:MAG TPA: DNA repair protein RecN [Clostridiaceae bacterium]|nr:DNA repair protein RecN [Clostridiaceae bacterium]